MPHCSANATRQKTIEITCRAQFRISNFPLSATTAIASLFVTLLMDENIESHLVEKRVFKPAKAFAKHARIRSLEQYRRMYRESIKRPEKFWAREAQRTRLAKAMEKGARMESAVREMVRRRKTERLGELPRPASRRTDAATRPRLSGKASRARSGRSPISNCIARSAVSPTC